MKKKKPEDPLEKLVKLTRLMKLENVQVAPKGPARSVNKWRSQDPKFADKAAKPSKPDHLVNVGGLEVDPSLQNEYEQWRRDKEEEQKFRREEAQRRARAAAERRARQRQPDY